MKKVLIFIAFFVFFLTFFKNYASAATLEDTFNGTPGTNLHAYNSNYYYRNGFPEAQLITGGVTSSGFFSHEYYNTSPIHDISVSVTYTTSDNESATPYFRTNFSNVMQGWNYNDLTSTYGCQIAAGNMRLYKRLNGIDSVIYEVPHSLPPGSHTITGKANGSTLYCLFDDNEVFHTTDNDISSGAAMFVVKSTQVVSKFTIETIDTSDLNVPLLKQTSEPWQGLTYDSANIWNPSNPTINRWGCALTSAVMVLKYYGYNKLPDGSDLNPQTLNNWLKSQVNGYVDGGLLNWGKIAQLSKLAKAINNITSFDTLEYQVFSGANTTQLTNDLNNNIPDILHVPGHFIVAKGITANSFTINDPYYSRTDLTSYGNSFVSLGRFMPAHSDLSYIMVALDTNIEGVLKDSLGNSMGVSLIEGPIVNPVDPSQHSIAKRMIYFAKPETGKYTLQLSGSTNSTYKAQIFLYNQEGDDVGLTETGVLGTNNTDTITINFNKSHNDSSAIKKKVTFDSVIQDINTLRNLREIKKEALRIELDVFIETAKLITHIPFIRRDELKRRLNELVFDRFLKTIKNNKAKDLTEVGYQILFDDIQELKKVY